MNKIFEIGTVINTLLKADTQLAKLVKNKIYPLVAEEASFPFIVYSRNSVTPVRVKYGIVSNIILLDIIVVSDKYSESITVAQAVVNCLENKTYKDYVITLEDCNESYADENYRQNLTFKIEIQ